jgi:hypothetical protein
VADLLLDRFDRENFAEAAAAALGRLRHCGAEDSAGVFVSKSSHILGDAFESIVV